MRVFKNGMSKEYMNLRKENDGKTGIITEGASQLVFFFF
jgi:hypothetical protein